MIDLKIEAGCINSACMAKDFRAEKVVLLAEVEKLIQEAVKFATIAHKGHWSTSDAIEATAFLNSPLVAAWRTGQEGNHE